MSNTKIYLLLALFLTVFWTAVLSGVFHWLSPKPQKYDCSMASWHPDIPKEVKQKCREMK